MYLYHVYVARSPEEVSNNDPIYTKALCTYDEVAKYVEYLNENPRDYRYYYFRRITSYISTDGIKTL